MRRRRRRSRVAGQGQQYCCTEQQYGGGCYGGTWCKAGVLCGAAALARGVRARGGAAFSRPSSLKAQLTDGSTEVTSYKLVRPAAAATMPPARILATPPAAEPVVAAVVGVVAVRVRGPDTVIAARGDRHHRRRPP